MHSVGKKWYLISVIGHDLVTQKENAIALLLFLYLVTASNLFCFCYMNIISVTVYYLFFRTVTAWFYKYVT